MTVARPPRRRPGRPSRPGSAWPARVACLTCLAGSASSGLLIADTSAVGTLHLLLRDAPLALVIDTVGEGCGTVARTAPDVAARTTRVTTTLIGDCDAVATALEGDQALRLWFDGATLWIDADDARHEHVIEGDAPLLDALRDRLVAVGIERPPSLQLLGDGLHIAGVRSAVVIASREAAALLAERATAATDVTIASSPASAEPDGTVTATPAVSTDGSIDGSPEPSSDVPADTSTDTSTDTATTASSGITPSPAPAGALPPRDRDVTDIPGFDTDYR